MDTSSIKVASLDVSCDKYVDRNLFEKRFEVQLEFIEKHEADFVNLGLQGIRHSDNLDFIKKMIDDKLSLKYCVYYFSNNESNVLFNCIYARRDIWKDIYQEHHLITTDEKTRKTTSFDGNASALNTGSVNTGGNPVGVGIVVFKHTKTFQKLVIASAQAVPFGEAKGVQQKASLSLADMLKHIPGENCPIIAAGNFKMLNDDRKRGACKSLREYAESLSITEIPLRELIFPTTENECFITDPNQIGTFNPWSTDASASSLYKQPLGWSKLDAIFASTCLEYKDGISVFPILMNQEGALNNPDKMTDEERESGTDTLRFMLKDKTASEHFLLIAKFSLTNTVVENYYSDCGKNRQFKKLRAQVATAHENITSTLCRV